MGNAPAKLESARMKRILVPIDFSDVTPAAIDLARQLGQAFGAAIHLVHVKELTAAPAPGALEYGLAGVSELARIAGVPVPGFKPSSERIAEDEDRKSKLAKWQAEIAQEGIEVRLHEVAGVVAEQILNLADQLDANMIVMGRHGHGAMYTLLLGSATQGVLKHSTRPVLLVPAARSVSRN
jgi:nucleotide-binding universal stress UspA family protein